MRWTIYMAPLTNLWKAICTFSVSLVWNFLQVSNSVVSIFIYVIGTLLFFIVILSLLVMKAQLNYQFSYLSIITHQTVFLLQLVKRLTCVELSVVCNVTYLRPILDFNVYRIGRNANKNSSSHDVLQKNYNTATANTNLL